VFPSDTESEDPRFIQRERELKEQRKDIETLKRAIDNIVEQTAREVDALKKENDELRDGINRALRALKKQRRMAYSSKLTEDIVDLTLE
jgi:beta-phosphoglucomutase-like phosphatase (HAD superfamily)